ncbi:MULTISPECIES: DUF4845 domain-containing protein [Marinobacter]|jgi:hypothetical protein|uniref:DUF4845 domain-containing protein n=1 Tax=Marinobacter maroccanus TaxID=2055143 RepID=A0A2S5Z984_9GAMM|nr:MULTISPECIES: DUF4845 domain-containing protein [Marinobacter]PTB95501.1 DUF4845 domain-containing protein [Marinobacter sp. B9-2]MBL3824871.1 DUF4845 domain-containing protein [Marinobacter sp. MC3]MBL3893377.1 DUF4845 domain-containing protein [Marinobacter sp. MW3]MCD1648856.1 DUF4845 domain-containing protein [Marinobacter adhaerens]OAN93843.1 DUF4845 domain-containing protein [Marinobacter sp. EhC06]
MKKNNLSGMGRQRGASALTMMVMVLFFGGLLTLVIKLGPAYLDDITIQEALESLDGTEGLSQMGPAQVRTLINKRLSVNNVRGFDAKNISVDKDGDLVVINVDYEVRNNLFSNVDTVVHFKHQYEMKGK